MTTDFIRPAEFTDSTITSRRDSIETLTQIQLKFLLEFGFTWDLASLVPQSSGECDVIYPSLVLLLFIFTYFLQPIETKFGQPLVQN